MGKHTPGPWAVSSIEQVHNSIGGAVGTGYRVHFDGPDQHWHVATVFGQIEENEPPATKQGHAIANAKLIAAAPEMLAALRTALCTLKAEAEGYGWDWDNPLNNLYEDCQKLVRIITKATDKAKGTT
jgi:hypothetical protein